MSEDNLKQLREDAALADENTLMRYIRVFSELSGQIRFASQERVMIELALIKLTRPQMEQSMDSVLERLNRLKNSLRTVHFMQAHPARIRRPETAPQPGLFRHRGSWSGCGRHGSPVRKCRIFRRGAGSV